MAEKITSILSGARDFSRAEKRLITTHSLPEI
jgi:hypothetical protein